MSSRFIQISSVDRPRLSVVMLTWQELRKYFFGAFNSELAGQRACTFEIHSEMEKKMVVVFGINVVVVVAMNGVDICSRCCASSSLSSLVIGGV